RAVPRAGKRRTPPRRAAARPSPALAGTGQARRAWAARGAAKGRRKGGCPSARSSAARGRWETTSNSPGFLPVAPRRAAAASAASGGGAPPQPPPPVVRSGEEGYAAPQG